MTYFFVFYIFRLFIKIIIIFIYINNKKINEKTNLYLLEKEYISKY